MKLIGRLLIVGSFIGQLVGASLHAARMNYFDQCALVPFVVFRSNGEFTAVGLTTRATGTVHFYFSSPAINETFSRTHSVTRNQLIRFIWAADDVDGAFSGVEGSLVACLDSDGNGLIEAGDGDGIAANAFLVSPPADVAFLPTFSVDDSNLVSSQPNSWTGNPVGGTLMGAATGGTVQDTLDMQYLIDGGAAGNDSKIVIWASGGGAAARNMTVFDGDSFSQSISLSVPGNGLAVIDLETVPGLDPRLLGDGLLNWKVPNGMQAVAFSIIKSPAFGATQTVIANY